MAVEITGRDELDAFLRGKPIEWSRLMAARSALRVLPVALSSDMPGNVLFSTLRACFISCAAGKYPAHHMSAAADSALFAARSARSAADFALSAADSARSAALSAAFSAARSAADSARSAALSAADFAARAAAFSAADSAVWKAVAQDANDLVRLPQLFDLLNTPLWPDAVPDWAVSVWRRFGDGKAATADGYAPWIVWYQGMLTGTDPFGPTLTLRIAQQPDGWWERPVREVNADIAAWLAASRESQIEIPPPEPGVAGIVDGDGRIGFARSGETPADELASTTGLRQVLVGALEELAALLAVKNSVAISPSIVPQYLACLRAEHLSIDMLYALGVRLGNARKKLQQQIDSNSDDYPDLTPDVSEALDSVLELHGPILLSTALGRKLLDASSEYLRTEADNAALKQAAKDYGAAVKNSPDLFNKEARELLPELNEDVGAGPHPERSTQVAMSASRNLLIPVAQVALQEVLKTGFLQSKPGLALTGVTAVSINAAWSFLSDYMPVIRELAQVSGPYLQWIEPLLRRVERDLRS